MIRKLFGSAPKTPAKKALTVATLPTALKKYGSGKNQFMEFRTTGTFTNPAANTAGLICLPLVVPNTWSAIWTINATDMTEQPQVSVKSIRIMANTSVNLLQDPQRLFCFIVSLKPNAITNLTGGTLGTAQLLPGTNYLFGATGNVMLNPDYFYVHKQWTKTMGGYNYPSAGASTNISDTHFLMKWSKMSWNCVLKNSIASWQAISETEVTPRNRLYFIAFQISTKNAAAVGQPLQLNGVLDVHW